MLMQEHSVVLEMHVEAKLAERTVAMQGKDGRKAQLLAVPGAVAVVLRLMTEVRSAGDRKALLRMLPRQDATVAGGLGGGAGAQAAPGAGGLDGLGGLGGDGGDGGGLLVPGGGTYGAGAVVAAALQEE